MMFRFIQTLAIAGIWLAMSSGISQAQSTNLPAETTLRGKLVHIEGDNCLVVQTTDNTELILMAIPKTKYLINGKAARFEDLRSGVMIDANYVLDGSQYFVNSVQVNDGPSANYRALRRRLVTIDAPSTRIDGLPDSEEVSMFVYRVGHRGVIKSVELTLDGKFVVTTSWNGIARVWPADLLP